MPGPSWFYLASFLSPFTAQTCGPKASAAGIPGASVPGIRLRIFLQNWRISLHEVSRSRSRRAISEASCPPYSGNRKQMESQVSIRAGAGRWGLKRKRSSNRSSCALTCKKARSRPTSTLMQSRALWVNCEDRSRSLSAPNRSPSAPSPSLRSLRPQLAPIHKWVLWLP